MRFLVAVPRRATGVGKLLRHIASLASSCGDSDFFSRGILQFREFHRHQWLLCVCLCVCVLPGDTGSLPLGLTAWDGVPGATVDDVAVLLEVLVVADSAVGVGHHQVGGGVDGGQPAEEGVVGGGRVLLRRPVPGAVEGVGDHQLAAVQVGAQHEGDVLHPADDSAGLRRHLQVDRWDGGVTFGPHLTLDMWNQSNSEWPANE